MGDSEESLINAINHYQSGLERYMKRQDEAKMLHNLGRLYNLPIKVCHLEKTGVGRTVNSLRKLDGNVGEAAKLLVGKWKEMVVQEEDKKTETSSPDEGIQEESVSNHEEEAEEELEEFKVKEEPEEFKVKEEPEEFKVEEEKPSHKNTISRSNNDKNSGRSSEKRKDSKYETRRENHSKENKHKEKHRKRSHSRCEENYNDSRNSDSDNFQENTKKLKLQKPKESIENIKHSDKHESKAKKSNQLSEESTSDNEPPKTKHGNQEKHESGDNKKHKQKSNHAKKEQSSEKYKSKEGKKQELSKHKEKKKEHKNKDSKEKQEEKEIRKSKNEKSTKEKCLSTLVEHSSHASSSGKKDKDSDNGFKINTNKSKVINSIGSESGTSFADALGMLEPFPSKKKKSIANVEKPRVPSPSSDENEILSELPLPIEPLDNLDINLSTLLPPITPNYRPLGLPLQEQSKKVLTDDEALSRVMMNKNQRTKVFSGNKVIWGKVPTLFDICIRILQDNIDALEYTGGVPYSILKPILEKATANQLYMMEHHNPYLIDDSDELWKLHCQKEFRNKSREELESWRDMYMRCLDEREAKLKALTANIKQSQDKSLPVRTTKLAYVDSVAKPPRNIARKQAKNDTASVRPSPSKKLASLATKGEAGKVAVPNPGARAVDRSSTSSSTHHQSMKPKKAPLMAKTLILFKNRFKR